jgi:hypothetical protein
MSALTILAGFALMLFLPCAFAFIGSREPEQDTASEYRDRIVINSGAREAASPGSAAQPVAVKTGAPLLRIATFPLIRRLVGKESDSWSAGSKNPVQPPLQTTAHRVLQTEIEALQAQAVAARAHAEALAANARAAAAKAEAAAEEATAAEMRAAAAASDIRRAA